MEFASDNAGPAHPAVLEALARANSGYASGYGNDPLTEAVVADLRNLFESPDAAVYLVGTGTAANSLLLATLANPWDTIFCTQPAHINVDECNAPEFFTGGAKLTTVAGRDAKMSPDALEKAIQGEESHGVHGPQRGPVSITNVTELGTVYSPDEVREISSVSKRYGLSLHMDGARFANAVAHLGCSPADLTWRAGVDALSFGGTKNGCLGVEACILFDPEKAWEFELRRKRGGHLFSKHRTLAAQLSGHLQDGLWLETANAANDTCQRLAEGLKASGKVTLVTHPQANLIFFQAPRRLHQTLIAGGAHYYPWDAEFDAGDPDALVTGRLVCDWSLGADQVDAFLALLSAS